MTFPRIVSVLVCALIMPVMSANGHAQDAPYQNPSEKPEEKNGFQFIMSLGITFGGDDFVEVKDENGDNVDDLEAGGLLYLGAGTNYRFNQSPVSLQAQIAYHYDSVDADNGDASFDRIEIDIIPFYNIGKHRIGLGLTQHFGPTLDMNLDYLKGNVDFDDATGVLLEYDYIMQSNFAIGVRYTDIKYEVSDVDNASVDGSNFGLFMHYLH